MRPHILLTGKPRTGKTTLLKRIIKEINLPCQGFYTEEITKDDKRIGFRIKTLKGKEGTLAMKGMKSKFRLGRYGINIKDLEEIGIKAVEEALKDKEIVVIDEIGRMELFSQRFRDTVLKVLDSGKRLVGVIHRQDLEFLNNIKSRSDVEVFEVKQDNHQEILKKVMALLDAY